MIYAVVMAGGIGSRFWPVSTPQNPKQLLSFFRNRTMIQLTLDRLKPLLPSAQHRIVTIPDQVSLFQKKLSDFDDNNYIIEPSGKNTAPCIGLSAVNLLIQDEDAILVVLPADHLIQHEEKFLNCLETGIRCVQEKDALVTLGIRPTRPETGYGYIQYERDEVSSNLHRVVTFAEKPNRETAVRFIQTGEFLWNSGIFICLPDGYYLKSKSISPSFMSH